MVVGAECFELLQQFGYAIAPVAKEAPGRGSGFVRRRSQHFFEEWFVDDIVPLMHPKKFHFLVLDFGIAVVLGFEGFPLAIHRSDDVLRGVGIEFDFREEAGAIDGAGEIFQQGVDRLPVDRWWLSQVATSVGDSIDPSVLVIAMGIANVMLQVADDGLAPIAKIEPTVGAVRHADRSEVLVVLWIGEYEVLKRLAFGAGSFVGHAHSEDPCSEALTTVESKPIGAV